MPKIYFENMRPDLPIPKPTPSSKAMPNWWKEMDRYIMHNYKHLGTIKNCPGVSDIMFSGYTLYSPTNIYVDASDSYIKYEFENFGLQPNEFQSFLFGGHLRKQTENYEAMEGFHPDIIKIQTFWGIKTEDGYSTMFVHPWHRMELPFYTSPAIVDTDKMATRSHYNFYIKKGFVGIIPKGTPLLQIFPFKRDDWESEIVDLDFEDMHDVYHNLKKVSPNPYKKIYWQRKRFY